jgi:transposase
MDIVTDPAAEHNRIVVAGVDTHADTHVVGVIDTVGRELGACSFPTNPDGYAALLVFVVGFGQLLRIGIEGTGVYGAGLCRAVRDAGVQVVEVDRPDRKARRFQGKDDTIDAYAAARAALSGRATGIPKTRDGNVEMIRVLRVARSSAVKARAVALTQLKAVIKTAPEPLRSELRDLDGTALIGRCSTLATSRGVAPTMSRHAKRPPRPGRLTDPTAATIATLVVLARRIRALDAEIRELDDDLEPLVAETAPTLLGLFGVGTDVAGQLLVTAGDNPDRLASSAAFAALCGVAPIPASSGKTTRHRLNRGGDRAANCALYRITLCRLRHDERTRLYRERRAAEQKTGPEIIRCLKRAIAREIYRAIREDFKNLSSTT